MIMFFVTISNGEYQKAAIKLHAGQEIVLASLGVGSVVLAYRQSSRLDISPYHHDSHTIDIALLLIPLPFYFLNNVLSFRAELAHENYLKLVVLVLITVHVVVQTLFIVDGMHRCSMSRRLRFKKPGREMVTFAVILNITSWIFYTFESKAVEEYNHEGTYYGKIVWMIFSHTTLPLMLFFRFHSSVCLADIWKFAYEKAHPD
jgi:hypothetical protein